MNHLLLKARFHVFYENITQDCPNLTLKKEKQSTMRQQRFSIKKKFK
jgi:hypothetical protein